MSLWTYFHGFVLSREPIPKDYFGMELKLEEYPDYTRKISIEEYSKQCDEVNEFNKKAWANFNEQDYLPCGSEGTLKYIYQNKRLTYTFLNKKKIAYTTKIVGSLRDYSQSEQLCDWFKVKAKELDLLQVYVSADSDLSGTYTWSYQSIGMDEKYCLSKENIF